MAPLALRAQAPAPRLAVVVGNAAYRTAPLRNPVNDATAMAQRLEALGFTVIELRDADAGAMREAMQTMRQRLAGQKGTGLFYFAGHGLQLDWRNYLLPVDADPATSAEVAQKCLDVQEVFDAWRQAQTRTNILILDACRDNPFGASASGKGLAPVDAPAGTYIAYATAPGHVADDGRTRDGNGVFTGFLLKELQQSGTRIEDVFRRVRIRVQSETQGRQVPWDSSSLLEDFHFGQTPAAAVALAEAPAAVDMERQEWAQIARSGSIDEVAAFLVRYPSGRFAEVALYRLDQLQGGRIVAQPGPRDVAQPAPGRRRYEVGDRLDYRRLVDNREIAKMSLEVTFANDQIASWNHLAFDTDQLGTVQRFFPGAFPGVGEPPETIGGPVEIALGKRWRTLSLRGTDLTRAELEHHVVARDSVEVPAGRFETFRVESTGQRTARGGSTLLRRTFWIEPATMTVVRVDGTDRPTVIYNPSPHLPLDPTMQERAHRFELVRTQRAKA